MEAGPALNAGSAGGGRAVLACFAAAKPGCKCCGGGGMIRGPEVDAGCVGESWLPPHLRDFRGTMLSPQPGSSTQNARSSRSIPRKRE